MPIICLLMAMILAPCAHAAADPAAIARLQDSSKTFTEIMASPRTSIPPALLQRAIAVAIIPNMIKASFFIGGRYGKGVFMIKGQDGRWGNPVLITVKGGSFGLQAGLQSTDLVLVFRRGRVADMKTKGNFFIGADVSVVAGRLGVTMDENLGADFDAEIYSFSRSAGLNAGFALQGATLQLDDPSTASLYGRSDILAQDVFSGRIDPVPAEVLRFRDVFTKLMGRQP